MCEFALPQADTYSTHPSSVPYVKHVPTVISLLSDIQTLGFSRHLPVSGSGPINTTRKVCVALTVG